MRRAILTPPATPTRSSLVKLFAGCRDFPHIALAVSGGIDSTALMVLVRRWLELISGPAPDVTVLTVDHKLRDASAAEALHVRAAATALGFAHHTLEWIAAKPKTGIQEAARRARYGLLTEFCRRNGIPVLLTAHTENDQAETLLMRLARGSGVDGLSAMAPRARIDGVTLLRPLLGVPRAVLKRVLLKQGVSWIDDPTNDDAHYERVRIRQALAAAGSVGLSELALAAMRLRRARGALDAFAADTLRNSLTLDEAGWVSLPLTLLAEVEEEIALRMLDRLARAMGGNSSPVPLAKLEAACRTLRNRPKGLTLGGSLFVVRTKQLRVFREYGRMSHEAVACARGMLWDGRYTIDAFPRQAGLMIRPLGPDGMTLLKKAKADLAGMPRSAALALPSLWQGDALVHAPCIPFPQGAPRNWQTATIRFANRSMLFDAHPEFRL